VFGRFSAAERTSWWGGILAHGHGVRLGGAEITPVEPDLVRTGEGMSEMTISDALAERGTIPRVLSIAGIDPSGEAGTAAATNTPQASNKATWSTAEPPIPVASRVDPCTFMARGHWR